MPHPAPELTLPPARLVAAALMYVSAFEWKSFIERWLVQAPAEELMAHFMFGAYLTLAMAAVVFVYDEILTLTGH